MIEVRRAGNDIGNTVLWVSTCYYDGSAMVYEGEELRNLYKTLETWVRLNCKVLGTKQD